ncbi:Glycosyltransferase involved in LPS biosynthesis, GR25 family [Roseovarius marisflavi]|uniref:Glycosyltransferase involved in LPS biosynthesis, GR25 family n=1 Tax=Roseovarius marisflavi TaxID=1054996 RepID=A0A1M6YDH0_9RHOB|nr:glycosyltransferase family 25 protein [Roseovarius marisflavi]SHL16337.1 Glycosyltransferase involved in LPS biosynthesis, GR25 family [Roseovarius marisflavi]
MQIRAFVLHLLRATARRDNSRDLLDNCALPGEIWEAVDGTTLSSTELSATIGAGLFAPAYPFALKSGEIGCFLSHRQIWAEIVRRDLPAAMIIEDDAAITPEVYRAALGLARAHIETLGYIQFQTRARQGPSTLIDMAGTCALSVPERGGLRTTAQMVGNAAARQLLALSDRFDRPVDTFVQSHWHTGLRPATILPSGVSDIADQLDGSTIQGGAARPPLAKLGREWARCRYRRGVAKASRHSRAPAEGGFAPGDAE